MPLRKHVGFRPEAAILGVSRIANLVTALQQEGPGFSDRTIRAIQAFSMENDRLLKVLGNDFPRLPVQAVEPRLLERIDPYETRAGAWLLKLRYLNRWLAVEETLQRSKRVTAHRRT